MAMVLGTLAEYQLSFTMAPVLIELAKTLSKDQKALSTLSMARTTASYKMKYGLAETFKCNTIDNMKGTKFSLNMDESTSENLHRVLTVLVSYFKESQNEVVVEHLFSSSLIKVDSQSIFDEVDRFFNDHQIPWENLVSILMDSCNVMRGSKNGFETKIRETRAGHLLDIDGDSCHHIHNASKYFCRHFERHIEGLHTTIFNDFKWSADLRDALKEICLILNVKFTMPDKMVPHRWLSCYDVTVSNKRMFEAYTVFYYAFLSVSQKVTYQGIMSAIYTQRDISCRGKERLKEIIHGLSKKKMTDDGKKRKDSVCSKLFKNRRYTKMVMNLYIAVLPLFKRYVVLFEMKEPAIHTLHEEQKTLMTEFLACFIKPEYLRNLSGKELKTLDTSKHHVKQKDMFMGNNTLGSTSASSSSDTVMKEFLLKVEKGYEECAAYMQKKLPLNSPLLKAVTSIDPVAKCHSICATRMKKLPELVTNVFDADDALSYTQEVIKYHVDKMLPSAYKPDGTAIRCDHYWAAVDKTKKYPALCKMAKALLSCFHGPQVESSFSNMGDIMDPKSNRMSIKTYSAIQTVRYGQRAAGKGAMKLYEKTDFLHEKVNPTLCRKMRFSAKRHREAAEAESAAQSKKLRKLEVVEKALETKKDYKTEEVKKAAKALKKHREAILKKLVHKRKMEKVRKNKV